MTADAFAIFAELEEARRIEELEAEQRCCVAYVRPGHRTWQSLEAEYKATMQAHASCIHFGHGFSLGIGQHFRDPRSAIKGQVLIASGTIVVCRTCLRHHVCLPNEVCAFNDVSDEGRHICAMTGADKGSIIVSVFQNASRDSFDRALIMATQAEPPTDVSARKHVLKRSVPPPKRRHSDDAMDNAAVIAEMQKLLNIVYGGDGVCRALVLTLEAAYAKFRAEVDSMQRRSFAAVLAAAVAHLVAPLAAVLPLMPFILSGGRLTEKEQLYLAQAAGNVIGLLRRSDVQLQMNNAQSAQGVRSRMLPHVLGALASGVVGRVSYGLGAAGQEPAKKWEVVSADVAAAAAMTNRGGSRVELYEFVPAHPFLRYLLPPRVPHSAKDSGCKKALELFSNRLRSERTIFVCLNSVLEGGGDGVKRDAGIFCLSKYMDVDRSFGARFVKAQ